MKNKIKSAVYTVSSAALAFPMLALAQFQKPAGTGLPEANFSMIIVRIMYWLLWVVGIAGVLGFAIAGIMYLISAGNQNMIDRAKKAMLYAILGIVVALAGLVAINFAQGILSAQEKF